MMNNILFLNLICKYWYISVYRKKTFSGFIFVFFDFQYPKNIQMFETSCFDGNYIILYYLSLKGLNNIIILHIWS